MIQLSLVGPADCPLASVVHDQVEMLARVPADTPHRLDGHLFIDAIAPNKVRLTLTAQLDGGATGERTFTGSSCVEVTDAAALTLALMLNPEAAPPDEKQLSAPRTPAADRPAAGRSIPRTQRRTHAFFGATGGARAGTMPAIAPEFGGTLGVSSDSISSWLAVSVTPTQTAHVADGPYGGRLWGLNGTWLGCWAPLRGGSAEVGPCAGVGFTRLAGSGASITHPAANQIAWISGTLGLSGAICTEATSGGSFGAISK